MALFNKRNNLLTVEAQPAKRGRGRPRKIEQVQQGSQPSTEIVQSRAGQTPKFGLPANKKWFYAGLVILIAAIPTIYFYAQNKNTEKKLNDLQNNSQSWLFCQVANSQPWLQFRTRPSFKASRSLPMLPTATRFWSITRLKKPFCTGPA
jgi:hypothetical protein